MRRPSELSLSRLESREVPAATLFADIRPGVWGSNPNLHGVSGDTLYFTANNIVNGNELWATDGTRTGTRMVADLNPGKPGSGIYGVPAGGGVFYFTQQNEFSRALAYYKTDGTAAGTVPVSRGLPDFVNRLPVVGWKGELYGFTRTATPGVWALSKSDGTTLTTLTTFGDQELDKGFSEDDLPFLPVGPSLFDGGTDALRVTVGLKSGGTQVWEMNGTPAGTRVQQANLTATSPTTGEVQLYPGTPVGGGRFLFQSMWQSSGASSVWAGDGTDPASRTLLRTFTGQASTYLPWGMQRAGVGGRVLFTVSPAFGQPLTPDSGVWVSDGTVAGTRKLDLPAFGTAPSVVGTFDDKAVVVVPTADPARWTYALSDGTSATPVPVPPGAAAANWGLRGSLPTDSANPKGGLVFQDQATGQAYRTDGTAAGTALVDTAGLPGSGTNGPQFYLGDWNGSVNFSTPDGSRGFYFKGDVYFPGRPTAADPRLGRELWKWDLTATPPNPPTTTPPKVTGTVVNDGSAQRSMVKSITVTFDSLVTVHPAGVSILNARGTTPAFTQQLATVNGVTTLTITFPTGVGGSIADGRWTLWIDNTAVRRQGGGAAMAADHSFTFTRLYGDLTGDGIYDRSTRLLVRSLLGKQVGDAGFNPALDVNGDGRIDAVDELAAVRNWGKAM